MPSTHGSSCESVSRARSNYQRFLLTPLNGLASDLPSKTLPELVSRLAHLPVLGLNAWDLSLTTPCRLAGVESLIEYR